MYVCEDSGFMLSNLTSAVTVDGCLVKSICSDLNHVG